MGEFIPGLELNAAFYSEVVRPLIESWPHAAARLGFGSEVLGFDTERSTDHGWGPHLVVFVADADLTAARGSVDAGLPAGFRGWPVSYGWDDTPVRHHVTVTTLSTWMADRLGVDPTQDMTTTDWLLVPQQKLAEVTGGAVYRDDTGELARVRHALKWYPEPVWIWLIACQWRRVAQEEAFAGRAAEVGDLLGSRLVAGRLARELMRLWFLFCRTYWPYTKWFGSAFARLDGYQGLSNALTAAMAADDWGGRETGLVTAYELVARRHNELGLTKPVEGTVRPYYGRPYRVLMADRFVEATLAKVEDPGLLGLPLVGSVDQVADSTDLLQHPVRIRRLAQLYELE